MRWSQLPARTECAPATRMTRLRATHGSPPMALAGFLDQGVQIRVVLGARDERRLQSPGDRLLRDHALGDVLARRQLEHDIEQRPFDDRAQAAGAGLAQQRAVADLPERVLAEAELERVVP